MMKKIPSLFLRNYNGDRLVRNEVNIKCKWVLDGEGIATRKWDGTSVLIQKGKMYKRREIKFGKSIPNYFIEVDRDDKMKKIYGWFPVFDGPEDEWHLQGLRNSGTLCDGTYELCGPKVNGNPEKLDTHILIPHGEFIYEDCPRTFVEIKKWLEDKDIEGIVWWNEDGRKAKIKKKDFGMGRNY